MTSNWWDNYREDIETTESRMSMDIECSDLARPIGFVALRERHRVKAVGVRRDAQSNREEA